jgi:thiamine transport system substrate-binding protein
VAALGVALAVGLAGYGAFVGLTTPSGPTQLIVYSYNSLLGGACGTANATADSAVFGAFDRAYHVAVEIECPGGTLVGTLEGQANDPVADVVLGLDEITGPQAVSLGLLSPYTPPGLSDVNANVTGALGSDGYVTPYEYGYLAIDYNTSFYNATRGAVVNWSFPATASNGTWASGLMTEDPTTDITGEEFLLWEIAFYAQVLHEPWQSFWDSVHAEMPIAEDWDSAFSDFVTPPGNPPMVVSYSLDPAYEAASGGFGYGSTVGTWNGTSYGWETVYGAGIVHGSKHLALDEDLVRWMLNGPAESNFPLNEWEYPANDTVHWPGIFADGVAPTSIVPLDARGAGPLVANLSTYLDEWQAIENGQG